MVTISRFYCGILMFAVQIVRALSFSFGRKEASKRSTEEKKHDLFSRVGGFFNKLSGKGEHETVPQSNSQEENVMPTQLRSLDVKASRKQWIPQRSTRQEVNPTRSARNIATGIMNDWTLAEEYNAPGSTLQYVEVDSEHSTNLPTFFSTGHSSLSHLNSLLDGNKAVQDLPMVGRDSEGQVNATMAFRIEITQGAAEITVSVGSPATAAERSAVPAIQEQTTIEHSSESVALFIEDPQASKNSAPEQAPISQSGAILHSVQAVHAPANAFMHNNATHLIHNHIPPPLLANANATTDLSYMALFCFGLGILCTYLLMKLCAAASAWYRGRVPRYIAGLEKQSIVLLSAHRYTEVKALLGRALPVVEGYKGPRHTDVAAFRHFLAKALLALGEHVAARGLLRSVVAIYETYGEDLYMAHALEDLALAQQDHIEGGENSGACAADAAATSKNAAALGTMRRALRIFTEEALAAEAISTQRGTQEWRDEGESCTEEEDGVCYVSSPSCTDHSDTTGDSPSLASSVASLGTCSTTASASAATPGVFAIRSSSGAGARVSGSAGSALWDRELLASVSDEEEGEVCGVEHESANNSSSDLDSEVGDSELHYYSTKLGHSSLRLALSLDSQDPRSPIYKPSSSGVSSSKDDMVTTVSAKRVLGELSVSGAASPLRASKVTADRTRTHKNGKKGKGGAAKGDKSGSRSNGGSPDNENTNPNNKSKPHRPASSAESSAAMKPAIYGTIHHTAPATPPAASTRPAAAHTATPCTTSGTPEEVSLRTALADLERLLAEPGPSPNTLIGPAVLSPDADSVCLDYSLDYGVGMIDASGGGNRKGNENNISTSSGYIDNYTDVYDCFDSAVKPTANPLNPLCGDLHTLSVVKDLNALLSRTPRCKQSLNAMEFGPIECVKDPHVGRVLHRVASLLGRLGRHAECAAYLHAASSVYCMLHGPESEQVRAIQTEIGRVQQMMVDCGGRSVNENCSDDAVEFGCWSCK